MPFPGTPDAPAQAFSAGERRWLRLASATILVAFVVFLVLLATLVPLVVQPRLDHLRDLNALAGPADRTVHRVELYMTVRAAALSAYRTSHSPELATVADTARALRRSVEEELTAYGRRLDPTGDSPLPGQVARLQTVVAQFDSAISNLSPTALATISHPIGTPLHALTDSISRELERGMAVRQKELEESARVMVLLGAIAAVLGVAAVLLIAQLARKERLARDIAELRRRELEQVTKSRERLIRGFTHDVKNPLGVADGYLALLADQIIGTLSAEQQDRIGSARRSIHQALELTKHLLDIARAEAGELEIRPTEVDVAALVTELVDAFQSQADAKGQRLSLESQRTGILIRTDAARLKQVIANLISNAVKYTPEAGRIVVRLTNAGEWVEIAVNDNGPGIPPEKQRALFQEFARFQPAAAEGTGLGLAISQMIAHALGATITVESEVGTGSTFSVRVPRSVTAQRAA